MPYLCIRVKTLFIANYMIVKDLSIIKCNGEYSIDLLRHELNKIPDGDYRVLVMDYQRNRALPFLKYLFGVVLKEISAQTNISVDGLYKFFERKFAPVRTVEIDGEDFTFQDIKEEKSKILQDFTDNVIKYADQTWGIKITERSELQPKEAQAPYASAYTDQWREYISNREV